MRHFMLIQVRYFAVCVVLAAICGFALGWLRGLQLFFLFYLLPLPIMLYLYRGVLRTFFSEWLARRRNE